MDPNYKELRKEEFLNGTMSWNAELTKGDHNRFLREYIVPLRQLNAEHIFRSFDEIRMAVSASEVRTCEIDVS